MIKKEKAKRKQTVLKTIREEMEGDKSQEQIAREVGMSLGAYRGIETGHAIPNLQRAAAICRALSISFKDFCRAKGIDVEGIPDDIPPDSQEKSP